MERQSYIPDTFIDPRTHRHLHSHSRPCTPAYTLKQPPPPPPPPKPQRKSPEELEAELRGFDGRWCWGYDWTFPRALVEEVGAGFFLFCLFCVSMCVSTLSRFFPSFARSPLCLSLSSSMAVAWKEMLC